MKKIKLGKHMLEVYDSIEDLPVVRFHKYNKMLLIDAGLGSDMVDFDVHIERITRFLKDDPAMATQELENLRQNVFLIQNELNPGHLAFCTLIKSIDGIEITDISDNGLKNILELISDVSHTELEKEQHRIKKKIDAELSLYFPKLFDNSEAKEYYDLMLRRTRLNLGYIIRGEDNAEEIYNITTQMLKYNEPKNFHGNGSAEVQFDKQFEEMCFIIAKQLRTDAKKYTVLEYYSAFEHIKESNKNGKQ